MDVSLETPGVELQFSVEALDRIKGHGDQNPQRIFQHRAKPKSKIILGNEMDSGL